MSALRLFGIMIGCFGLLITFFRYRGPKWNKANFLLISLFNIGIIIVSIYPNTTNLPTKLLSLEGFVYGGRLFALLIISNVFLLFLSFYIKSKQETIRFQFDKLIRNLGAVNFRGQIDLDGRIKPIMVLMPAYNESKNLQNILYKIPNKIEGIEIGVLVIDDGSEDDTVKTVQDHGYLAVSNIVNRGGGAALRLGYDILQQQAVSPICITMDADGQHSPEDIEKLVEPLLSDELDFVIGSRILGESEKDSLFRHIGVYVFGFIVSLLLGKKITDPSCNFRAFKMNAMKSIHLYEDQYHTSELIIEAVKKGMRIGEVPIKIHKRKHGKSKKGRNLLYGFHFARAILKTWWR